MRTVACRRRKISLSRLHVYLGTISGNSVLCRLSRPTPTATVTPMQQCQAPLSQSSTMNDNACMPGVISNTQERRRCRYCDACLDDRPGSRDDHLKLVHGFRGTMWKIHCLENESGSSRRCSLLFESLVALLDHAAVAHGGKVRFEFASLSSNRRPYAVGEISFTIKAGEVFDDDVVDEVQTTMLEFGRNSRPKRGMDWLQVLRMTQEMYDNPNSFRKKQKALAR